MFPSAFELTAPRKGKGKCLLLNYQMALPGDIRGGKETPFPYILKMSNKLRPCSATTIFLLR